MNFLTINFIPGYCIYIWFSLQWSVNTECYENYFTSSQIHQTYLKYSNFPACQLLLLFCSFFLKIIEKQKDHQHLSQTSGKRKHLISSSSPIKLDFDGLMLSIRTIIVLIGVITCRKENQLLMQVSQFHLVYRTLCESRYPMGVRLCQI